MYQACIKGDGCGKVKNLNSIRVVRKRKQASGDLRTYLAPFFLVTETFFGFAAAILGMVT